jgi:uncharacterized membrane protein YeaQ/YmgE (transglycosylase-associated protein family)
MGIFHLIWIVIVGLVVGLIAHFIVPSNHPIAWYFVALIGIAGSFVGGFIASLFSPPPAGSRFHPAGFFMSIIGAIVVMIVVRYAGL